MNWQFLPAFFLMILPALAQDAPPEPSLPKDVQEFLSVPTWYLSYRVSVVCRDGGSGSNGSSWSIDTERIISGSAQLGIRSPGPSLSLLSGTPPQPEAFIKMIDTYANWIGGIRTDETQRQEDQDAALMRVIKANHEAVFERFRLHSEREYPGTVGESSEPAGMERERITESGSAPVYCLADFHLEIDAVNKKFRFKFSSGFTDTEQSAKAVTGDSASAIGQPNESHRHVETSMHSGTPAAVSGGPTNNIIEGDLPDKFGNLSGSPSYPVRLVRADGYKATMIIQFALSPKPPEPVELIIEPPQDFEDWQPEGGDDEKTAADFVTAKIHLQKPGGGVPKTKATRFEYRLVGTSHEKGVCLNWPPHPVAGNPPYDLQFEPSKNPNLVIADTDGQSASQTGGDLTDDEVTISCFDYGASSTLSAEAKLEDGRYILGTVKGTGIEYLNVPARKPGSRIASAYFKDHGLGALPDDDDSESAPEGDSFNGDGFTLYEEYRGFMEQGSWTPGNPKKKDVFVLNEMRGMASVRRGIKLFENVSKLEVHAFLEDDEIDINRSINFNHTDAPHVTDQHVIWILPGKLLSGGETAANVKHVGTPGTARRVRMPPDWQEFVGVGAKKVEYFAPVLAHEMLHSCNIWHHGEADQTVEWLYVAGFPPQIVEAHSGPITVKTENGTTVDVAALFPDPAKRSKFPVWLGVPHGQHSGHEDCLMRYDISFAYKSSTDPSIRYLTGGEMTGMGLCTNKDGTGINDPAHKPQSRYGTPATPANGGPGVSADRGDCTHQLRVNDLGEEPHR